MSLAKKLVVLLLVVFFCQAMSAQQNQPFFVVQTIQGISPRPHYENGFYYIDVCPDDLNIHLVGAGNYPNNGTYYQQSDATSTFVWTIGDQVFSGVGMTTLNFTPIPAQGYTVSLNIIDVNGLHATAPVYYRIRTSKNLVGNINLPAACPGDEVQIGVGYSNNNQIQVEHFSATLASSLAVHDTIFLPDGENCPPYGALYRSPVTFTQFPEGSTIESEDNILSVCMNFEHSYAGDISIQLFCPNGQSASIKNTYDGGDDHFGLAFEPDHDPKCDESVNPHGDGWNYCWSNNTTEGYVYAMGDMYGSNNIVTVYNPHFNGGSNVSVVDSTNTIRMQQVYHPQSSFANLVGCPLNGEWYIEVQDVMEIGRAHV